MTIDSNDAKCNKIDEQSRVIDIQQVDLKCDAQRKKNATRKAKQASVSFGMQQCPNGATRQIMAA